MAAITQTPTAFLKYPGLQKQPPTQLGQYGGAAKLEQVTGHGVPHKLCSSLMPHDSRKAEENTILHININKYIHNNVFV